MGTDCYGWVEVLDPRSPVPGSRRPNPYWWSGIIRITDLVDRNYRAYGYFFGVRDDCTSALADHRGVPPRMSEEARADSNPYADDPAGLPGVSWVLWSEVAASDWQTHAELKWGGWDLIFSLMAQLAQHYGGDRVRLVVWFTEPGV